MSLHCNAAANRVSTHASAREATSAVYRHDEGPEVSTHASAREATALALHAADKGKGFNPRLRAGGD